MVTTKKHPGRPRTNREQVTMHLSPEVLAAVRGVVAARQADPSIARSQASLGATVETLLWEALNLRNGALMIDLTARVPFHRFTVEPSVFPLDPTGEEAKAKTIRDILNLALTLPGSASPSKDQDDA